MNIVANLLWTSHDNFYVSYKSKPTLLICNLSDHGQHWGLGTSQYSIPPPTRWQTSLFELIIEVKWVNTNNVVLPLRDKPFSLYRQRNHRLYFDLEEKIQTCKSQTNTSFCDTYEIQHPSSPPLSALDVTKCKILVRKTTGVSIIQVPQNVCCLRWGKTRTKTGNWKRNCGWSQTNSTSRTMWNAQKIFQFNFLKGEGNGLPFHYPSKYSYAAFHNLSQRNAWASNSSGHE